MTFGPGRLVVLCGLVPTLVAALLSLYRPPLLRNWEYGTYDAIVRATPTRAPGGRIVIVDIDDRSLTAIGQWPWRRDVIGQLISRLRDLGASTVALDIMFAEPDRYEGPGAPPDEALAETLRAGRAVLGYAMTFDRAPRRAKPVRAASDRPGDRAPGRLRGRAVLPGDRRRLQSSRSDERRPTPRDSSTRRRTPMGCSGAFPC